MTESLLKSPGFFFVFWPISKYCSLIGLHLSSYFQVLQSMFQSFGDRHERANYNWYHHHVHVAQFFHSSTKVHVFISLFAFFQSYPEVSWNGKGHSLASSLFCWLSLGLVIWLRLSDPFVSQHPREDRAFHFPGQILGCAFIRVVKFKLLAQFPVDHFAHPVVSGLILSLC